MDIAAVCREFFIKTCVCVYVCVVMLDGGWRGVILFHAYFSAINLICFKLAGPISLPPMLQSRVRAASVV